MEAFSKFAALQRLRYLCSHRGAQSSELVTRFLQVENTFESGCLWVFEGADVIGGFGHLRDAPTMRKVLWLLSTGLGRDRRRI